MSRKDRNDSGSWKFAPDPLIRPLKKKKTLGQVWGKTLKPALWWGTVCLVLILSGFKLAEFLG